MEELNIMAILKDKPDYISYRLYSPYCGAVRAVGLYNKKIEIMNTFDSKTIYLNEDGTRYKGAECMLYPSEQMRDWDKFQWKKGDVLMNDVGEFCFFIEWSNNTYTNFEGKAFSIDTNYTIECFDNLYTSGYTMVEDKECIARHISAIENYFGKHLNLSTLELEDKQEFKDGDIVATNVSELDKRMFILKGTPCEGSLNYYVQLNNSELCTIAGVCYISRTSYCLATEEEKQQLFDALAKEGKKWDAENHQIIDINKIVDHEFKPFEQVLVRNKGEYRWMPAIYINYIKGDEKPYVVLGVYSNHYKYCIPYQGNEHLLGTTDNPE